MFKLAQEVELSIAAEYKNMYNFVGTPGTTPSTAAQVGEIADVLNELGVYDEGMRYMHYESKAMTKIAANLQLVFPTGISLPAIEKALIGNFMGLNMVVSNVLPAHTVGVSTGTPLINGADQDVTYSSTKTTGTQTLITNGWTNDKTGILLAGDIFTIAGVNSVNRSTLVDTGRLQNFVVKADADSGATTGPATFTISPPIIIDGNYQTVTAAPADDAVITVKTGTGGTTHKQNIGWHKNALTVAIAPIDDDTPGAESAVATEEGVSIRTVKQYSISTNKTTWRFDIRYGVVLQNDGFAIRHTS